MVKTSESDTDSSVLYLIKRGFWIVSGIFVRILEKIDGNVRTKFIRPAPRDPSLLLILLGTYVLAKIYNPLNAIRIQQQGLIHIYDRSLLWGLEPERDIHIATRRATSSSKRL